MPCAVQTQHALLSITIAKAAGHAQPAPRVARAKTPRVRLTLSAAAGRQRALDDAAAGAAGAEELLVVQSVENMACARMCG